ncbi:hypothetical protein RHMOL_Rhmol09G0151400 [Rhododendron molle]|uniref:Uncharacterized protein n=1 Tax=Rhododendron molle TaxID=49168 RepID=A0ACC0MFF8_RHOML|nr:hypothetical protein RHMOL_Rhmol09G0151400 [Rhododendron molle]
MEANEEVLYDLDTINVSENSIRVNDPNLGNIIRTNGCNVFGYLNRTLPIRPYISFTISPGLTLFKCTTISPELDKKQDVYFGGNDSYRGCSGYTVYYEYPYHSSISSNASVGLNCSVIELPVVPELGDRNASDLYSVLASEFSIRFHVSKECQQCQYRGRQCSYDGTGFQCRNEKEGDIFSSQSPRISPSSNATPAALQFRISVISSSLEEECLACLHDGGQCLSGTREFQRLKERGGIDVSINGGGDLRPGWGFRKERTIVSTVWIMGILLFCIIMKKFSKSESTFFWKKKTENYRNIEAFLKNCGYLSLKRYSYSDIKKITDSFRTKLGQGGFRCVFKGMLENDCLVAVKVLKELKGNGEDFINEVATISRTSHVNIVTLLGFCFEGRHRALIYEFMPSRSLDNFIHDGGSSTYRQLGWDAMYRIAVGIARGLEYLHRGCKTRILHFDIKPHNICLDGDFCPKISDFGLAKLCPQKESIISLTGARGTAGYIAPEVFSRNFGGVSHKSDVYSYGMMVLEMVGGRKNISVKVDRTSEIYFPHWVYKRLELDEELRLHGITDEDDEANASARKMIIVGLWCIQTDPSNRPSMSRVVEMLEGSTESLQIPPSLICLLPQEHRWIRPLLMP